MRLIWSELLEEVILPGAFQLFTIIYDIVRILILFMWYVNYVFFNFSNKYIRTITYTDFHSVPVGLDRLQ